MRRTLVWFPLCCAHCLLAPLSAYAVTIPTVPVGNAGNAGELSGIGAGGYGPDAIVGAVAYSYRIGTTEVTNAQYAEFLNAKAASDPLGLYNTSMGSGARGGIMRSGVSGSFTYAPKTNMGNKPANYVSWYDAIRFANWLNNGQGAGDTETGAYTLLGGTPTPSNGLSITRNPGAIWFLPSEDEWHKSAYYDPTLFGGSGGYWDFPTRSNTTPTMGTTNSTGDISNPGSNVANYGNGVDWNSQNGNVTTVGSAGPLSDSFYGTQDQGGNVWEWNEVLIFGSFRGLRGGSWADVGNLLESSARFVIVYPTDQISNVGFRLATVPEPGTAILAIVGCVLMLWWIR